MAGWYPGDQAYEDKQGAGNEPGLYLHFTTLYSNNSTLTDKLDVTLCLSKCSSWQPPSVADTEVSEVKDPTRGVFYIMRSFISSWCDDDVCVCVCDVTKALRFKDE